MNLTKREREIVNIMLDVMNITNAEIANMLNITIETLKTHIQNIYKKLGVTRTGHDARLEMFMILGAV